MSTTSLSHLSISTACRWAARLLSLLSIGVLLLFIIGEGFNPLHLAPRELLLSLFFPIGVLLGMGLAWRWEALGGTLTIGSLLAFYAVHWLGSGQFPGGVFFALFASPGLLFLLAALTARPKAAGENA
jgi:hypothetical protein